MQSSFSGCQVRWRQPTQRNKPCGRLLSTGAAWVQEVAGKCWTCKKRELLQEQTGTVSFPALPLTGEMWNTKLPFLHVCEHPALLPWVLWAEVTRKQRKKADLCNSTWETDGSWGRLLPWGCYCTWGMDIWRACNRASLRTSNGSKPFPIQRDHSHEMQDTRLPLYIECAAQRALRTVLQLQAAWSFQQLGWPDTFRLCHMQGVPSEGQKDFQWHMQHLLQEVYRALLKWQPCFPARVPPEIHIWPIPDLAEPPPEPLPSGSQQPWRGATATSAATWGEEGRQPLQETWLQVLWDVAERGLLHAVFLWVQGKPW